jgi:hypothetical protein
MDVLAAKLQVSPMKNASHFEVVCRDCAALGVRPDYSEGASSSTIIRCSVCDAPRGTLGALQNIAHSNRRDLLKG